MITNTSSPVNTQQFVLEYDPIGNRKSYQGDNIEGALVYTTNELNHYTATSQPAEAFEYHGNVAQENDGNLTRDGKYDYTYDGENRLTLVTPRSPTIGSYKVKFTYDYLGRRVQKEAWPWTGSQWSTTRSMDRRFVYDGWNP